MANKGRDYLELYYKIKDLKNKGQVIPNSLSDQLFRYECELESHIYWKLRFFICELLEKLKRNEIDISTFHEQFLTLCKSVIRLDSAPVLSLFYLEDNMDPKMQIFTHHVDNLYTAIMDWDWEGLEFQSLDENQDEEARRQSKILYREVVMDMFAEIEKLLESE